MADKTSREAILERCTPIDEVRGMTPEYFDRLEGLLKERSYALEKRRQDLERKGGPKSQLELEASRAEVSDEKEKARLTLQEEISTSEREFSSHNFLYRLFFRSVHEFNQGLKRQNLESGFNDRFNALNSYFQDWTSLVDAIAEPDDDVFYLFNNETRDFYVHNPPESWRPWKPVYNFYFPNPIKSCWSVTQITPVDVQQDISTVRKRFGMVFLHGFELKDLHIFERPYSRDKGYLDDRPGGFSCCPDYSNPYTFWHPSMNNLLLILEKDGQIPCWVSDNNETTTSETFADGRKWKIDPTEWRKMVGQRIEFFTRLSDSKPVYMPQGVWDEHSEIWQNYEPGKYVVTLGTFNKQSPIELVRIVH